jgi:hypothetical protein
MLSWLGYGRWASTRRPPSAATSARATGAIFAGFPATSDLDLLNFKPVLLNKPLDQKLRYAAKIAHSAQQRPGRRVHAGVRGALLAAGHTRLP